MTQWYVYIVRCGNGTLYTGIATNVRRRIAEHRQGNKGAKYLRGKGPLKLVLSRLVGTRSFASRIEYRIKKLTKARKEQLVARKSLLNRMLKDASV